MFTPFDMQRLQTFYDNSIMKKRAIPIDLSVPHGVHAALWRSFDGEEEHWEKLFEQVTDDIRDDSEKCDLLLEKYKSEVKKKVCKSSEHLKKYSIRSFILDIDPSSVDKYLVPVKPPTA